MNPYNTHTVNIPNMPELQQALAQNAQLQNQLGAAQQMQNVSGWGGGLDILGAALGRITENKKVQQLSNSDFDIQSQIANYQQQMQQNEAEKAATAETEQKKAQYDALVGRYGAEGASAIVHGGLDPKHLEAQDTPLIRNLISMGLTPGSPEFMQAMNKAINKPGSQVVNNLGGQGEIESEFQKKLAGKNADKYGEYEQSAWAANEMLGNLSQMEQISQLHSTGKLQEAGAALGQWFGMDSGSALQQYDALVSKMMLEAASTLSGAMSDGEWKVLKAQLPTFGRSPEANAAIIGQLKNASQRLIDRYDGATKYIAENGKMQGFQPEFNFSANRAAQPEQPTQEQPAQAKPTASTFKNGKEYELINGEWYEK